MMGDDTRRRVPSTAAVGGAAVGGKAWAAGTIVLSLTLALGTAQAQDKSQDKTFVMKITTRTLDRSARGRTGAVDQNAGERWRRRLEEQTDAQCGL